MKRNTITEKQYLKTIKVPIRIVEYDSTLRNLLYRCINAYLNEAVDVQNTALKYIMAYRSGLLREELQNKKEIRMVGHELKPQTHLTVMVSGDIIDNAIKNVIEEVNKVQKEGGNFPNYKNPIFLVRNRDIKMYQLQGERIDQYHFNFNPFTNKKSMNKKLNEIDNEIDNNDNKYIKTQLEYKKELLIIQHAYGKIDFQSCFSHRDKSQPVEVSKIISGEYKLCDSSLSKDNGKLFLNLSVKCPVKPAVLDPNKICGVDLGVNVPAYVATNFNLDRRIIGNSYEINAYRTKCKHINRRKQAVGDIDNLNTKAKKWQSTYNHNMAKQIIEFCLKNNCGTIQLEDLKNIKNNQIKLNKELTPDQKQEVKKKNKWNKHLWWTPYQLLQYITHKASKYGINVVTINPKNTSRTCSKCSHVDTTKTNVCRIKRDTYICNKCGERFHADYNAARNIAQYK
jgi:IS605 OrfB family transposase